ncbi:hypothetical protein PENPOL_c001G05278 [Penicillium polonicum]|uniref:Uncharacterized protein n=1 Tax=Penicillium polonicum TaxID=60169 RepID=A0A1V6P5C2_PENPO|nr:hypothetical protein PENPOL_c001G05278 [Penicillium polonicum]
MYLYLAFQGTFCDTTMYLYVSEIFLAKSVQLVRASPFLGNLPASAKLARDTILLSFAGLHSLFQSSTYFFPGTAGLTLE